MAIFKSSNSGIPFGNTAGRPASPGSGQPYFNGELQRLELYTGATYGWQNIVAETPGVTGYTGNVIETNTTNTITITGTNFASGATASLIGTDGTEYVATTTTVNNLTQIVATFGAISASKEPYDIKVTNPSNLYGVYYDVLIVNDRPIWSTAAGSLGTFNELSSISITLSVTDEENNAITYSLASGSSLPSGITLNSSTGVISGTLPNITADTTYTFTINASDGFNTLISRTFSITSIALPVATGGTLTSDSTYYYRTFTANADLVISEASLPVSYLIVAGGGSSGGHYNGNYEGGGGGAGGMLTGTATLTPGTYSMVIGAGGTAAIGNGNTNGINSTALGYTATGGGLGGAGTQNGGNGGSGGGAGWGGAAGTGQSGQGNNGGGAGGSSNGGGGGGGKSSIGGSGSSGGNGGAGLQWINGSYYAGGGAGGRHGSGSSEGGGIGGVGGGGNGQPANASGSGNPGTANTGGGAGGGWATSNSSGSNGGSGVVIIAYTKASVGG